MRRSRYIFLLIPILALLLSAEASAQKRSKTPPPADSSKIIAPVADTIVAKPGDKVQSVQFGAETIGYNTDDFAEIDTVPQPQKYKSRHMLGFKYSYDICNVSANPTIGQTAYFSPLNFSLTYTYYHALWDYLDLFGLQMGVKYGREGYNSEISGWGESVEMLQFSFGTQVHVNFWKMRILINAGPYYGYKLSTDKPGGFDENDIRHDYGIYAGGGVAFVFGAFELQLEANYQFSLCSMYHTYKYSDLYWLSAYPRNLCISAGIFINLW